MDIFKFKKEKNTIHIISLSCNPVPPIRYGGIELVIANLCEELSKLGCNVACYSPGEFSIARVRHFQTLSEPSLSLKNGGIPNSLRHLQSVKKLLKRNIKPGDVIVFNHPDHFRYLKRRLGILPFIIAKYCEIAHWVDVGMMSNIIYPSEHLKQKMCKPGICIPHGEKLLFKSKYYDNRDNYLFFAGRITKDKGVDIALKAAKLLKVPFYIAGPLNDKVFAEVILTDTTVIYLGELTYPELFEYYCNCRAMVYMTQYVEPFGLSIIEAMAAGAPIITTGLGGTGETIIEGETGFFAKTAEDIVNVYQKVSYLDEKNIVERAMNYTADKMALNYLNYFLKGSNDIRN